MCPDSSIYTKPNDINCNGAWYKITYDECKEKCRRNELPDCEECEKPKDGCRFAIYEEGNFHGWYVFALQFFGSAQFLICIQ